MLHNQLQQPKGQQKARKYVNKVHGFIFIRVYNINRYLNVELYSRSLIFISIISRDFVPEISVSSKNFKEEVK